MGFGVFIHRTDSIYEDSPAEQYQFPGQYLTRVQAVLEIGSSTMNLERSLQRVDISLSLRSLRLFEIPKRQACIWRLSNLEAISIS